MSEISPKSSDVKLPEPGHFGAALVLFAVVYAVLVCAGRLMRDLGTVTIFWPAAGLLFVALWFSSLNRWPWILGVQIATDLTIGLIRGDSAALHWLPLNWLPLQWALLIAAAHSTGAVVAATFARRLILNPALPRIRQITTGLGAVAVGSAASAVLGAFVASHLVPGMDYVNQWQLWWAANCLGCITVVPVAATWGVRLRIPELSVARVSLLEVALSGFVVLAATWWIFSAPPVSANTLLKLPYMLLVLVIIAAFRLPPRWSATLVTATVMLAAWFTSRQMGPFAANPNQFSRVADTQIFMATLMVFTFMLGIVLLEKQRTLDRLSVSEERYRSFVTHSSEAVWRVELSEPLPMTLPIEEQIAWLKRCAFVAECNLAYRNLAADQLRPSDDIRTLRDDVPWFAIYLEHLRQAARQGYSMDNLRFTINQDRDRKVYWASFSAVMAQGQVVRIWGVARDMTSLTQTTDRLRREQDRLRQYALELTNAEERARRAVAVDLHDGIAQSLAGLGMNLRALMSGRTDQTQALIRESDRIVEDIQHTIRGVITDLSPPGLYDLGLDAALQWLAGRHESMGAIRVTLDVPRPEPELDLDTRVFAFRIIRECLQNVVKHARGAHARVSVASKDRNLTLRVSDDGAGRAGEPAAEKSVRGFGLWSIHERVRAVGGAVVIKSAPGVGFHVRVVLPHGALKAAFDTAAPDADTQHKTLG